VRKMETLDLFDVLKRRASKLADVKRTGTVDMAPGNMTFRVHTRSGPTFTVQVVRERETIR
jgi:hypothetical protein